MANIENRRIKRKLLRIGAVVIAALAVCAVVLAAVFLPRACVGASESSDPFEDEPSEAPASPKLTEPAVTDAPSSAAPDASFVPASEPASETAAAPSAAPVTPRPSAPSVTEAADPVYRQTSDDRSLALFTLHVDSYYDGSGIKHEKITGSCVMRFVNNTDLNMYSASFGLNGFEVACASINGAAARFYREETGRFVLPFSDMLSPGGYLELYFEFGCDALASAGVKLPVIAYDTVYDVVCIADSDTALAFSCGESVPSAQEQGYLYRLRADGVREVAIGFPS